MAEDNSKLQQLQEAILSGNIPQMVLSTISYALDVRSSDIHIEPEENTVRIRYRVDGVLRQVVEFPHNIHPAVVSRIKIMSNLKIDEQRMPQDGRSTVTTKDGREMDLRISTLPTVKGEKVVMRIQDKSREIPDLPELGLQGASLEFMEDALSLPNGIILTTGPTGSGKTTTMYSALTRLNKVDVNIMTIEDPVEIQLDGLNQSQVHPDIDYTFANGLRTALRQDPDIIMVGEIRDRETIDIAIESSLTGHLVFSTIHTNSAVETLTRILNMGVPPFLLASSIELIIAQRLVRKLCPACKIPAEPDPEILKLAKKALSMIQSQDEIEPEKLQEMNFYGPKGCEECDNIGFKGRVGLYEVMRMSNELRRMILSSANTLDIEKAAMNTGMVTLEQVGIIKALKGETSLDEVYRVAKRMELEAPEEEEEQSETPAPQQKETPPAPSKESQKEGKKLIAKVQTMPAPAANKPSTVQKNVAPQKEAEPVSKEQPPVVQESPPAPQKADPAPSEQQKPVPMESPNPQQ